MATRLAPTAIAPLRDAHGRLAVAPAKEAFLHRLALGETVIPAIRHVGRTRTAYHKWRAQDEAFSLACDAILNRRRFKSSTVPCPPFPEFCAEFLHQPLWEHQMRWWDILQGDEPRSLHENMRWSQGDHQMLLLNVPPGFGKSMTITVNYVMWRVCRDPNIRVLIISASEKMAKKFLYAIKQRMVNPAYSLLQQKFGPEGGFRGTAESWTATEIYLGQKDDGEKDPTIQALGMGGQIYGARADLIIVDDAVLLKNAQHYEDQIDWLTQDVITRLPEGDPNAKLIVVGTRVASVDLYSRLRDEFRDEDDEPVFTYFAQPAVLEYAESPDDWVSLWPETHDHDGNVVPKWSGRHLKQRREKVRPATWAMVYQQLDVSEDSTFDPVLVQNSVQGMRKPGPLMDGDAFWNRPGGGRGCFVVAGLDPAAAGYTAAVVLAVDRQARRIFVLDVYNKANINPRAMRDLIEKWTIRYHVNEWQIEENAFQRFLVQDDEVRGFLFSRGVVLKGHHTTGRGVGAKLDPDLGVASMASLFEPDASGRAMVQLPCANSSFPGVASLVEQLIAWQPGVKSLRQDTVMAFWFAAKRAREVLYLAPQRQNTHLRNPFLSRGRRSQQMVIDLNDVSEAVSWG